MKRLHPVSAAFRAFGGASAAFGLGLTAAIGLFVILGGEFDLLTVLGLGGLVVVVTLAGAGYGVLQYRRFEYDVRDETVSLRHGVLARTERDIPFGRIQNVDIRRGVVARLLGVATVNMETAGGGSTEAVLQVVSVDEAERIQDVVAGYDRRETAAAGETGDVESEPSSVGAEEADGDRETTSAGEPSRGPQRETLFELSNERLAILSIVAFDPSGLLLLIFSLPFGQEYIFAFFAETIAFVGGPAIPELDAVFDLPPIQLAFVAIVAAIQFTIAAWAASAVVTALKYYDFRLLQVGDDLRYERGLVQRYTGTIPLEKVQTVTVRENVGMRRADMAALNLETAGYGPGQSGNASNTAIPLDDRDVVIDLAERLGEVDYPEIERPPKRSRRRYAVRYALVPLALTAVLGAIHWSGLVTFPRWWIPLLALPAAPVAGHYKWKHRGHALTDRAFLTRTNFWRRHTRIVPYYRIQTVIDERSIFQRWRDLASVTADTASTASVIGGDATAYDVDEETAVSLHRTLRERLAADLGQRRAERGGHESADGQKAAGTETDADPDDAGGSSRTDAKDDPDDSSDATE